MALVTCPECGRENVSDSAESCPNCGFGIKAHFDKIQADEKREEQEKRGEQHRRQVELEEKRKQNERLNSIERPEKPKFSRTIIVYSLFMFLISIFLNIVAPIIQNRKRDIDYAATLFLITVFVLAPLLVYIFAVYLKKYQDYSMAEWDFEEYKKKVISEQDEITRLARQNMPDVTVIKCPNCGSTNTKYITTANRMTSVAMVGIASDKIGKQYECKRCKYKW